MIVWERTLLISGHSGQDGANAMEELQKTQEYAAELERRTAELERRRAEQPYQGEERRSEDRRRRANWASPVVGRIADDLPVSTEDGTGKG